MLRVTTFLLGSTIMVAPVLAQPPGTGSTSPAGDAATGAMTQPGTGSTTTSAATATSGAASVTPGASVADTQGGAVGTIESVSNGVAVLSTGTNKVSVPTSSFAKGANGLVIAMTKSEIDAKASAATAAASAPAQIAVGATVADQSGAKVGTVKAVSGDMVTVASETASAQLPKSSFAKGPSGLVIAMSPAQFEAAAKAAGGQKSASTN